MKKFGLALGSSGSRGSSYIGFLKALEEEGLKPSYISGSSMGSIVGGCYCSGMSVDTMIQEMTELKFSQLIDVSLLPMRNLAILRSNKLIKKLDEYFAGLKFSDMKIPFSCVATDLKTGKTITLKDDDEVTLGVAASSCMPSIFKPIVKGDMTLVDGGVSCRLPIQQVRELGAKIVIAVDALGPTRIVDKQFNLATVFMRSIDIMDGALTKYALKELKPDLVIKPDLGDMSQYKFKNFDFAIEQGYKVAKENMQIIKELLN